MPSLASSSPRSSHMWQPTIRRNSGLPGGSPASASPRVGWPPMMHTNPPTSQAFSGRSCCPTPPGAGPVIVPNLSGQIDMLRRSIAVGCSVPSRYGGASYPLWELAGRRVDLLGGSPKKQFQVYLHLAGIAEVMSADGNYAQNQAVRYAEYWTGKKWIEHEDVKQGRENLYLECFRRSCRNIRAYWQQIA